MKQYRGALEEFAREKAPQPADLARLQQAVRLRGMARPPSRLSVPLIAWSGWAVAAACLLVLLGRLSLFPSATTPIASDPSVTSRAPSRQAAPTPAPPEPTAEQAPAEAPCSPQVRSIAPSHAVVGLPMTFTVTGTCLPASAVAVVPDCNGISYAGRGDSLLGFSCTPATAGRRTGLLRTGPDGARLFTFVFDVSAADSPGAPAQSASPPAGPAVAVLEPPSSSAASPASPATLAPAPPARLTVSAEQALNQARSHVFRIEGVLTASREALVATRSKRVKQCLNDKVYRLTSLLSTASEARSSLLDALRRGDDAVALTLGDRVAQARRTADAVYIEAQGCISVDD
jgi:hypothetical protein